MSDSIKAHFPANTSDRMIHLNTICGHTDSYGKFTTACICDSEHTIAKWQTFRRQRHSDVRPTNINSDEHELK